MACFTKQLRPHRTRAPGLFVSLLERKAESAGTSVHEFPTTTTRLSQTCHQCGAVVRKPLAERWHVCACGVVAQRDLYAAFLALCINDNHLNADLARERWSSVDMLLQAALRTVQPASGGGFPASFGLNQRPSPVCEPKVRLGEGFAFARCLSKRA
jgi:putative transposase